MNPTATSTADPSPSNLQYYPLINNSKNAIAHLASTIATASDLDMSFKQLSNSRETVTTETFAGNDAQTEFAFTLINALQLENNLIPLIKETNDSTEKITASKLNSETGKITLDLYSKSPFRQLYSYQSELFFEANELVDIKYGRFMIQMPTGAGKTRLAMEIISHFLNFS